MEGGSKLLKVVSIIMIVYGAIVAVLGLVTTMGGGAMLGTEIDADADVAALGGVVALIGAVLILSGAIEIVTGVVGLKASKDYGKHRAAFIIGILSVVFAAISLFTSLSGGSSVLGSLVGLVLPILYLVGVYQTRQGA